MRADPTCRWCQGCGKVRLLNKLADCECLVADETEATASDPQAVPDFLIREFGEAQSATSPGDDDTFVFGSFPEEDSDDG